MDFLAKVVLSDPRQPGRCGGRHHHMRIKRNSESLLLSAMLNTREDPSSYGVTAEMFHSYSEEFHWLMTYEKLYGTPPSQEALVHKFPDFPLISDAQDSAFAAEEVITEFTRRQLVKSIHKAADHLEQGDIEEAMLAVSSFIPPARKKPLSNDLSTLDFLSDYELAEQTLSVPWETLQKTTGGIREGDLWYVAARLSQGKSWVLANFAANALLTGHNVRFYSLEMSRRQVLTRMHVLLGAALDMDVDHIAMRDKVYDPIQYRKVANRIMTEVPGQLSIADTSNGRVSPTTVAQDKGWADLVLIDYAGLMSTPLGGRAIDDWRSMGVISNMLKEVAVSHDLRIVAAAQINRDGDTGANSVPPKVKNLAQSDSLGQDADVVLTHKQMSKSVMVYGLEKNRHGEAGIRYYTRFLPNTGRFNEIDKDRAEDIRDEENDD